MACAFVGGIRKFPPRIMRHTAASGLVQDGMPLYDVQAQAADRPLGIRASPTTWKPAQTASAQPLSAAGAGSGWVAGAVWRRNARSRQAPRIAPPQPQQPPGDTSVRGGE